MSQHPALTAGRVAVITGAASGIGLAAAERCAGLGLRVCLADRDAEALGRAAERVARHAGRAGDVIAVETDVSDAAQVERLCARVYETFGDVALLMNNAGIEGGGGILAGPARWREVLGVNLWGVLNGVQRFAPAMIEQGRPAAIVNTGSKQGITCPPGDFAYNVSKAGIKTLTEGLAHELRNIPNCRLSAHLLIPGFVFTGLTRARTQEKPPAAWLPEQMIDFMLPALAAGDFYILCPDNEVTRETDAKRIAWAAGDIIENRPALSRWHRDFTEAFARFQKN
jgi:NAD(P)-dependent dehydrogenase (short-subunit alcohol dehydrogenase family)